MKISPISLVKEKLFGRLTIAVKVIVFTNIGISILFYGIQSITSFEMQYYFGTYPTYSDNFHFYQLFTFMFVHSTNPVHIISNILFLLIFTPAYERKFCVKKVLIAYFICAWSGFLFINLAYYYNKEVIEESILNSGISPKDIELDKNNMVNKKYLNKLNSTQYKIVERYNHVTSKTYGASGALFGFILLFLLMNFRKLRKIPISIIGLYLIYQNIDESIYYERIPQGVNASSFAHFGGMLGGVLIFFSDNINAIIKSKRNLWFFIHCSIKSRINYKIKLSMNRMYSNIYNFSCNIIK